MIERVSDHLDQFKNRLIHKYAVLKSYFEIYCNMLFLKMLTIKLYAVNWQGNDVVMRRKITKHI